MSLAKGASPAVARSPENEGNAADELGTVEVVGMRTSLSTAQEIKREKIEIVDSIIVSDINKLPDSSTTDALSRVTGIQIARDRGEGSVVVGAMPICTAACGWLDASVTYRFNKEFSIALEGSNLLRTVHRSYYGVETRPQSTQANDRQLSVTIMAKF